MSNTILTPNMNLPVPVPGVDSGPDYALNIGACFGIIDNHNHTLGQGEQVPSAGLNINADLPFNNNNAVSLRSVRFQVQASLLGLSSDVGCLYVSGQDLYYNDESGNQVRITQSGGVAGTPGSITGLTSPASASYVSASSTFVFQSAVLTPANLDAASIILRNLTASSKGLTLNPPSSMATSFSLTLPSQPSQTSIMQMTSAGVMEALLTPDGVSVQIVSNQLVATPSGFLNLYTAVSTNQTVSSGVNYLVETSAGAIALQLPAPVNGAYFNVKDQSGDALANPITVLQFASETIEGVAATKTLQTPFGSWGFSCDGTNWWMN